MGFKKKSASKKKWGKSAKRSGSGGTSTTHTSAWHQTGGLLHKKEVE